MDFAKRILDAEIGATYLFSMGQAGFVIKSASGQLLAVDLYLSDCVESDEGHIGFKRLWPSIIEPKDIVFDYVIATHPHLDHYDRDTIPKLMANPKTMLLASEKCRQYENLLKENGKRAQYYKPGDSVCVGDFEIDFINCDHGILAPDAFGVIISVDKKRICMTGDTCLRLDRKDEYLKKGKLDILIGPINGAYGNMNEEDFATLSAEINPKLTIPCHFGMFASHGGSPLKFINTMNKLTNQYLLMTVGEKLVV